MPLTIKPSSGSGSSTLISVAGTTTNDTLTLPAKTGNLITSADSGTVTGTMLAAATVAQSNLATNVAGNGPAFSAYPTSAQTISHNTYTKVQFDNLTAPTGFNLGSCFNNTGSTATLNGLSVPAYAFMPNIAGYYQINYCIDLSLNGSRSYFLLASLYRNGAEFKGSIFSTGGGAGAENTLRVATIIYLNGTTDYLDAYVYSYDYTAASTVTTTAGIKYSQFCGSLIRSA